MDPRTASRTNAWRRLLLVAAGLVVGFVLLEICLQVAAFVQWRSARTVEAPANGRVVLCIGDSFTFGLGAADPETESYPAHLQRALDARAPGAFCVVKAARPGRTSAEAVERLPDQLALYRPEFVVILLGMNDTWYLRDRVLQPPAASGALEPFPWRLRTLRLLDVLRAGESRSRAIDPARVLGAWHAGPSRVEFNSDGSIVSDLGNFRWRPGEARVEIASNETSSFYRMHLTGDVLELEAEVGSNRLTLERGEPPARALDLATAAAAFRAAPSPITAEPLLAAAEANGDLHLAIEACVCLFAHSPLSAPAMRWFDTVGRDPARRRAAIDAFTRAVDALPNDAPGRPSLLRNVALFRRPDDPDDRMRRLVEAWLADRDEGDALHAFNTDLVGYTPERLAAALRALGASESERAELERILEDAARLPARIEDTLFHHLTLIVNAARAAGAEPILLSYPEPRDAADAARARIVRELGVREIDVRPEFEQRLRSRPRAELFVQDGHSTDAGYRVTAEQVANALIGASDAAPEGRSTGR